MNNQWQPSGQQRYSQDYGDHHDGGSHPRASYAPQQQTSAAFEFMRSIDPNGGGNSAMPESAPVGPPRAGFTSSMAPPNVSRRTSSAMARGRISRAGRGNQEMSGSPPSSARRPGTMTNSMASMRAGQPKGPAEAGGVGGGGVGVGIYDIDSNSANQQQRFDNESAAVARHSHQSAASGSAASARNSDASNSNFLPNAPYQQMLSHYGKEDPTVERARTLMASHQGNQQNSRPTVKAGPPQPPTAKAIEPNVPSSRLGRRCLTHRPKRQPDFVRGKVHRGQANNRKESPANAKLCQADCPSCGALLDFAKTAIVVHCPNCNQVNHTATFRIRIDN